MTALTPRVGVLAVGRPTFDVEFAKTVFGQAWSNLNNLPIEIIGAPELHFDGDGALKAFAEIESKGIDILLFLQVTFTDSAVCAEIAEKLNVPLIVWTYPEDRTGGRLRLNSFCGVNLASHTLSRMGKRLENVHGPADSKEALQQIADLAKAATIVRKLSSAKVLVVGDHPIGFDACNYDAREIKARFGVSAQAIGVSDFISDVKKMPDSIADAPYARRAKDFSNLAEMDQEATRKTLKIYAALSERADKEGLDGIAIRCWPEFFTEYGCAACGAIALLNEDKKPGGCEADMFGVLSSLVMSWTSGKGVFNTDLVDIDAKSDTIVFWHCGQAPLDMADPHVKPQATIHSNRKLPLLSEFPLKPGRVTMCRISQGHGKLRMVLGGAEMMHAPLTYSGTAGVARPDIPTEDFRQRLLDEGLEHHSSITYGEHRPALRHVARFLGLEVVELT